MYHQKRGYCKKKILKLDLHLKLALPDLWLERPCKSHAVQIARIQKYLFSSPSEWRHQHLDTLEPRNRCAVKVRKSVWFRFRESGNNMSWWQYFLRTHQKNLPGVCTMAVQTVLPGLWTPVRSSSAGHWFLWPSRDCFSMGPKFSMSVEPIIKK